MRLIAKRTVVQYAGKRPDSKAGLTHWLTVVTGASWACMSDVMTDFPKAKTINAERVTFDVAGGDHRLIASIDFVRQAVFVKFIGSHAEYDRVDALTVSQF
jgi:mRNA interferase HigB